MIMEDSQSISARRMSTIILELSQLRLNRTNIQAETRSHCVILKVDPETISIRPSGVIASENIVRMSDPETSRRLISVEERPTTLCLNNQVILDQILSLSSVFNKDSVAHGIVGNVIDDLEIVHSMESDGTIVSLMDSVIPGIGLVNCSNHMEMNGVATQLESLTHICEFNVFNLANDRLISR
jgi:hypothetical protein